MKRERATRLSLLSYLIEQVRGRLPGLTAYTVYEPGSTVQLSADGLGDGTLQYQWQKDTVPISDGLTAAGSTIVGALTATLQILNAQPEDAGAYAVTVSNTCGAETSPAAVLSVDTPTSTENYQQTGVALSATKNPVIRGEDVRMTFSVPGDEYVTLVVYDVKGRVVAKVFDGVVGPGSHSAVWDGREARGETVAAGVYYVALSHGASTQAARVVVLP